MAKRRTQGNGTVAKRPNGRWQARFTTSEGKRLTKTFPTKREAEEWLTDVKADTQRCEFIEPSEVTLIEWLLDFLKTYKQATHRLLSDTILIASSGYKNTLQTC